MILTICPKCHSRNKHDASSRASIEAGNVKCGECLMATCDVTAIVPEHSQAGVAALYAAAVLGYETAMSKLMRGYGMSASEADDLLIPRR